MTDLYTSEVLVAAPPEHVFRFFVEPELLVTWLGRAARLDPRPGGEFRFEVADGEWCSGAYLEVDPPSRVSFTWGWESGAIPLPPGTSRVEVDLLPDGQGTRLRLVHRGLQGDVLRLHADGWPRYLDRLGSVVAGRDPGQDPASETPAEALDRLADP